MAVLKANKRNEIGTRRVRPLRRKGDIPGIVYGHGEAPVPITLNGHDLDAALSRGERLLELEVDGRLENILIKDVQYDAMGNDVLHVDLARVDLDERVKVTVPIMLRGTPAGAVEGGVLHQVSAQMEIECAVRAIPDDIRFSVAEMKVNDLLHMRDLPLPEGAKLISDGEAIVATVRVILEVEPVAPAEGTPALPEVIGEKKEEEEEGKEAAE
jgi:large subunit ribosomal protein L25